MFQVVKKLKNLKKHLNGLNWKNGNLYKRVADLKEDLKLAQANVEAHPHDNQIKIKAVEILNNYQEAVMDEEKLLYQQAKVEWLREGDRNSAFFHKVVKSNKHKNRILSVLDANGNEVEGDKIVVEFVNHFKKFLEDAQNVDNIETIRDIFTKKLTSIEANRMVEEISDNEIKTTMFDIDDNRAPGPNGYTSSFFKKAWRVVGKDVCSAVKEFFQNRKLLGELNATLVTLILKIQKLLVQMITDLLHVAMSCINGRQIQDNIMVAQELLKGYNRKGGAKRCSVKINIAKIGKLPVKYLGVPLITKRLSLSDCKQMVDKVKAKMFWASVFLIPKTTINDIEKVFKGFLWC
ncbi:hypothetical protein Tco_0483370 [Tanacetum coccineum]